jgi:hypothetical protein
VDADADTDADDEEVADTKASLPCGCRSDFFVKTVLSLPNKCELLGLCICCRDRIIFFRSFDPLIVRRSDCCNGVKIALRDTGGCQTRRKEVYAESGSHWWWRRQTAKCHRNFKHDELSIVETAKRGK